MPNSINYATIFNSILDQIFYILPRTMWMENTMEGLIWNGGREIKIPKIATDGLGTMSGNKAPSGSITFDYETKQLEYYRGRNFEIGRYDVDETKLALTVGNVLNVFLKQHVIPEVDVIRIGKVSTATYGAGYVSYYTPAAATILTNLVSDIAAVQDKIGEDEQLYVQISTTVKNILKTSGEITRMIGVRDMPIKAVNLAIEALDTSYLIGTPSARLKTCFGLYDGSTSGQTAGGTFSDALAAQNINWIVASRRAVEAIARPQISKVITPDENQEGEFWKIMFSIYHGVWTYDNKLDGLRMSLNTSLGTVYVTSTDSETAASTVIKAAATSGGAAYSIPTGYALYYKTHTSTAPTVTQGTALDSTWTLMTGSEQTIAATNGHKITVALAATGSKLPLASGNATIVVS